MPMHLDLGVVNVEVEHQDDAAALLGGLLRHLNNLELAALLGVTDKTVRRWKREGRLPSREGGQVMLLDLLQHLAPRPAGSPPRLQTPRASLRWIGTPPPAEAQSAGPRPDGAERAERGDGSAAAPAGEPAAQSAPSAGRRGAGRATRRPRPRSPRLPGVPPSDPGAAR